MTFEGLQRMLKEIDSELEEEESTFDESTDALEDEYNQMNKAADSAKREAKKAVNYNMLKAIMAARSTQNEEL